MARTFDVRLETQCDLALPRGAIDTAQRFVRQLVDETHACTIDDVDDVRANRQ